MSHPITSPHPTFATPMKILREIRLQHKALDEQWFFSVQGHNSGYGFGILELERNASRTFVGVVTRAEAIKVLDTGEQNWMFSFDDGSQMKLKYWDYDFHFRRT